MSGRYIDLEKEKRKKQEKRESFLKYLLSCVLGDDLEMQISRMTQSGERLMGNDMLNQTFSFLFI